MLFGLCVQRKQPPNKVTKVTSRSVPLAEVDSAARIHVVAQLSRRVLQPQFNCATTCNIAYSSAPLWADGRSLAASV